MSTTQIPKGTPFVLVYYDPDCRECQDETREIIKHKDELSDTRLYFITDLQFSRMKLFNQVFKIDQHKNIVLGRDYSQSFYKLFKPSGTPYTIVYDGEKKMRAAFSGQAKIDDLLAVLNKAK
ncbi:TlpA family protein disulfide reductase [Chitinophaga rupis]|nr:thioredoxin fold domain-containing protein [Chitinophaga rupis]